MYDIDFFFNDKINDGKQVTTINNNDVIHLSQYASENVGKNHSLLSSTAFKEGYRNFSTSVI